MQRWTSDPLDFAFAQAAAASRSSSKAVEHDGPSYTVLTYLNNPDVPDDAGRDNAENFAAAFTVFAHGDCWGDVGHCEPTREPVSGFDLRPEHPLTGANFTVDITEAVKRLVTTERIKRLIVTALVMTDPGERQAEPLQFEALSLVVFESAVAAGD